VKQFLTIFGAIMAALLLFSMCICGGCILYGTALSQYMEQERQREYQRQHPWQKGR
jgi:hypothetical protein